MRIARFDEWQTKRFPEKVGNFHCFLSETIATARTLLHLSNKLSSARYTMTKTRRIDGCNVRGYHQKRGSKDLGYDTDTID